MNQPAIANLVDQSAYFPYGEPMNGFKYLTFEGGLHQEIVLFVNTRDHAKMANLLGIKRSDILGAGFVSMSEGRPPECYGQSISLEIGSRGQRDTRLLRIFSGYDDD